MESNFGFVFIVNQMEFDKTKWSCPWNSRQNCTQNSTSSMAKLESGSQPNPTIPSQTED